jgi:hypothetical protein
MPYAQATIGAEQGKELIPAAMYLLLKTRTDSPRLRGEIRSLAEDQAPMRQWTKSDRLKR